MKLQIHPALLGQSCSYYIPATIECSRNLGKRFLLVSIFETASNWNTPEPEVRSLLNKKDEEIEELKTQLTVNLREVTVLREEMRMEADLTAVDIRGFRMEIDRLKQLLAKKLLEKETAAGMPEASAEEIEEAVKIRIQNLARALALL